MNILKRFLNIEIPRGRSAFLWGARKTGKSTYLKHHFPKSLYFDFLKTDLMLEMNKSPALLRERILAGNEEDLSRPIILDEIQKVPSLMDEAHWLIENKNLSFIFCGSSARKLRRGAGGMLGGRAWRYEMRPLTFAELGIKFELLRALNCGMIPDHYLSDVKNRALKSYVYDYLKEEVFAEGLTRNIPAFSRFFDAMSYSHGELVNYANIARECMVDAKTVREYYHILVDTWLGTFVEPFKKRQSRQVIMRAPKFYLFDVGVAGVVTKRRIEEERGELFGKAFEHFIFMELSAYRVYRELDFRINFWRTKQGAEVDFVLGDGEIAVEVKGGSFVDRKNLQAIKAFSEDFSPKKAYVVCNEKDKRIVGGIKIYPWKIFLEELWADNIIR